VASWGAPSTTSPRTISDDHSITSLSDLYQSITAGESSVTTTSLNSYRDGSTVPLLSAPIRPATLTSTAAVTAAASACTGHGSNSTSVTSSESRVGSATNCTAFSMGWTTGATVANSSGCMQGWNLGNNSNISTMTISGSSSAAYETSSNGSYYSPSGPTMTVLSLAGSQLSLPPFALAILLLACASISI
jgi:hypothetical protein